MPWEKTDRSFKTLINKVTTDSSGKYWYNEISAGTLNVHTNEIWADQVNSDPSQAIIDGVVELRTLMVLTWDNSVPNNQCYYAYESGNRLMDWVSTKYSDAYTVHLYDNNNNEIFTTDASQWFFDYQTGILTFNGSTSSFAKPFKVTGYRYIGTKGVGTGESGYSGMQGYSGYSGINATGDSGYSGISGWRGETGYSGIDGRSGYSGHSGYSGRSGLTGYSGYSGSTGTSGFSGYSGSDGAYGSSGFSGQVGTSGWSGYSGFSSYSGLSGFSSYSGIFKLPNSATT